jgi:hypothetical protein
MKKYLFLLIAPFFILTTSKAQKQLWGTTRSGNFLFQGIIVKYDINGENTTTMHTFDYPNGKVPEAKLFLASNGKLYGTTTYGGINGTTPNGGDDGNGVLYEYDLTFDTYRVVHYFNGTFLWQVCPTTGLIEPIPGKLYGGTLGGGFFVYDLNTETVTTLNHTYSFEAMGGIYGDLVKASNGFLYAVSNQSFACNSGTLPNAPNQGSVVRINTTTNTAQRVTTFNCNYSTGLGGGSTLVEALPNRLFFSSNGSLIFFPDGTILPAGTIIEFNTLTNTLISRVSFDFTNPLGYGPKSLVLNENGNLYGVCQGGGDTYRFGFPQTIFNKTGTIFEFNPTTNVITKLRDIVSSRYVPITLIKLSTGDYMGNFDGYGLFKYKANTNDLILPDLLTYNGLDQTLTQNIIEICRKPSYQKIVVNTFTANIGGIFTYDVQNTNATSYQWQLNGTNVVGQTTGVLNLTNITAANAGGYTCVMTNECGTTTTAPLTLTVTNLGINTVANLDKAIILFPNPAANFITIELPKNIDVQLNKIKISDMLGKEVFISKDNITKIDISNLPKGIYIMALQTNYGDWNGKFVKE